MTDKFSIITVYNWHISIKQNKSTGHLTQINGFVPYYMYFKSKKFESI